MMVKALWEFGVDPLEVLPSFAETKLRLVEGEEL
jgi:hypothetical protein